MNKKQLLEEGARQIIINLQEAHYNAGLNNPSISRQIFQEAYNGSGSVIQAVCAGLLSTGSKHAPLTETRELLQFFIQDNEAATKVIQTRIQNGYMIPGLGNSFFKDSVDPVFQEVVEEYRMLHLSIYQGPPVLDLFCDRVNEALSRHKDRPVQLYPNAAGITAAICELVGGDPFIENFFFISARSRAWLKIISVEPNFS